VKTRPEWRHIQCLRQRTRVHEAQTPHDLAIKLSAHQHSRRVALCNTPRTVAKVECGSSECILETRIAMTDSKKPPVSFDALIQEGATLDSLYGEQSADLSPTYRPQEAQSRAARF
jgi:hypothetical protein